MAVRYNHINPGDIIHVRTWSGSTVVGRVVSKDLSKDGTVLPVDREDFDSDEEWLDAHDQNFNEDFAVVDYTIINTNDDHWCYLDQIVHHQKA